MTDEQEPVVPENRCKNPDDERKPEQQQRFMICVRCNAVLHVPPSGVGRRVKCPTCGHKQFESDPEARN
jgi:DNA-directed RNA polymerase subunit RPC12/RpoP